jgi:hypothetical protein
MATNFFFNPSFEFVLSGGVYERGYALKSGGAGDFLPDQLGLWS